MAEEEEGTPKMLDQGETDPLVPPRRSDAQDRRHSDAHDDHDKGTPKMLDQGETDPLVPPRRSDAKDHRRSDARRSVAQDPHRRSDAPDPHRRSVAQDPHRRSDARRSVAQDRRHGDAPDDYDSDAPDDHDSDDAQDAGPPGAIALVRQCASELVATLLFVFIGTMSVVTGNDLLIAVAHGLTITLLIACFGDISGGHINPVVTLGVWLGAGVMPILHVALYVVAQMLGGILGAVLTRIVLTYDVPAGVGPVLHVAGVNHTVVTAAAETVYESIRGGSHNLTPGIGPIQAIIIEIILTFILVQTVLMVAVEKSSHILLAPVAIGLAVLVDIAVACNLTGGSMNPARSFGPAAVIFDKDRSVLFAHHYVYWIGPVLGSLLSVLLHRLIFAGPHRRIIGREH